jgi:hypothetical protein
VIGTDRVLDLLATERPTAFDYQIVGANAIYSGAQRDEEVRQVLHVRLARRVRRMVFPFAATAATSAFSVAVTLGSSRKTSAPVNPETLSRSSPFSKVIFAPSCSRARK